MSHIAFCGCMIGKVGNQLTALHNEEGAVFFCVCKLRGFLH